MWWLAACLQDGGLTRGCCTSPCPVICVCTYCVCVCVSGAGRSWGRKADAVKQLRKELLQMEEEVRGCWGEGGSSKDKVGAGSLSGYGVGVWVADTTQHPLPVSSSTACWELHPFRPASH